MTNYRLILQAWGLIVLFVLLLPSNIHGQEVYTVNPYVQPNESTLYWYGSGDANGDDTLTNADLTRMQEYINGNFSDPSDRRFKDRMDVSGDEVVNQQDYNMMQNHMQNRAPRDPEWYWANLTKSEKNVRLEKIIDISKIENACQENGIPGEICDCSQYATQQFFDFHGTDDQEIIDLFFEYYPHNYRLENMNKFNIPNYRVMTQDYDFNGKLLGGHAQGVVTTGDNFLNFSDLYFLDDQFNATDIQPGEWGFALGDSSEIRIRGLPKGPGNNTLVDYTTWDIVKGVPYLRKYNTYHINLITQKPEKNLGISTNINLDSIYEAAPGINVNISDLNLKFGWISSDNGLTKKALQKGSNNPNLNLEGENNELWIYVKDIFDRDTIIPSQILIQDIYAPRIQIASPIHDILYGSNLSIEISIDDPNFKQAKYSVDQGFQWTGFNKDTTFMPYLNIGEYTLMVQAEDNYGNTSIDSVSFIIADLDSPSVPIGLVATEITETTAHLAWVACSDNIGIGGYRVYLDDLPIDTSIINSHALQDLEPNTTYRISISAYDAAGNESAKCSAIDVTTLDPTVGIVVNVSNRNVRIYPNPVGNLLNIEKGDIGSCNIKISSLNGQIIYEQEIIEQMHQIDLTYFQKGIYFITIRSKDFVTTRKIIKL